MDINTYVDILQRLYKANVDRINSDNTVDYVKIALTEAEQIWLNVQVLMRSEEYGKMNDEQKINLVQKDFKEFYKNFPIVARYMICLGQYKMKAFKKMLTNNENSSDKNEEQWIKRQADYVRFLWEEYNTDKKGSDKIWQHTYETLSNEFKEFKELHEKMEKKVKEDNLKHKKELLYEMSERIITGKQKLNDNDMKEFLSKLQDKLFKQRFGKLIKQLSNIKCIEPVTEGLGNNDYAKDIYEDELQQSHYKKTYKKMDINKIIS